MVGVGAAKGIVKEDDEGHSYPPVYGGEVPPSTARLYEDRHEERIRGPEQDSYAAGGRGEGEGRGLAHAPTSSEVYQPLEEQGGEKQW